MTRISMLATLGALALLSAQPVYAATTSEAASAWTDQFSGERGASVHIPLPSLQSPVRTEKRVGVQPTIAKAYPTSINQFD